MADNVRPSGGAGAGNSVFRFGSGTDLITDFMAGADAVHVIEWHGPFTSFAGAQVASDLSVTVLGSASMGGKIMAGTDELFLHNITKAVLLVDDSAYL